MRLRSKVCQCGRGYQSRYDRKCGHCRSTKEQKTHEFKLRKGLYPPQVIWEGQF
jgi:hypothetical protein